MCFKTGPPVHTGVELEWTLHHTDDPTRPISAEHLRTALGPYAPPTLAPDGGRRLPAGGTVTVEPGGQVEISTPPFRSLAVLHRDTGADVAALTSRLADHGLTLGTTGIDPHRTATRVLETPRYAAMERAYDRRGPHGRQKMCSTAGLQVCVDAGEVADVHSRWRLLHAAGPPLLAAFANARRHAGRDTGHASARMATWWEIDPSRTAPVWTPERDGNDPTDDWIAYALDAEVMCVRRSDGCWDAPAGVTFAGWIDGALPDPPTVGDLEYHLSTLFPPVRPRGYLEVRYLDAQPGDEWIAPAAVLAALLADPDTVDEATDICAPTADRWAAATRCGLRDPAVARTARRLLDLACARLPTTDLPAETRSQVTDIVHRRLATAEGAAR
ncbi:glutamate--cysteine ligase EgtA [Virgisporangium aliadipatigenens]|uniref:Glutamate--cysteine ligase EgtA n=1 Tax=Virgisporangium aliadipatigenens TaxID=741659 RepID=A0A8J4DPJ1_9ACTN|nr:glutamate--cysteine ligase EgtA [Virgisporangium aliadipatigenens]